MDRPSSNAGTLQALAPALAQALRQRGLGHLVLFGEIVRHWHDIAGPQLAAVTQPESIRARVLFIMVMRRHLAAANHLLPSAVTGKYSQRPGRCRDYQTSFYVGDVCFPAASSPPS